MSNLDGFRTRPSRTTTGYANAPAEEELASYKQLDLIDRLRKERKLDPLPRKVSSIMTKSQAGAEIDNLFATPKHVGPPPSLDGCPPDWDADVWNLVLLFEEYARADDIRLRAGRPVIYAEIDGLVTQWNMREKSRSGLYKQEVSGCTRRELSTGLAAHCWYHWPPGKTSRQEQLRVLTWVQVVEILMAELWSRVMDENALEHFRRYFAEYGLAMANHWKSLRIIREIASQPKQDRPVMRRRVPSGTMAVDSKEG
jgi:hypothetical protein